MACIWYLVITSVLMVIQAQLEKHYGKGFDSRPLAGSGAKDGKDGEDPQTRQETDKVNKVMMAGLNA